MTQTIRRRAAGVCAVIAALLLASGCSAPKPAASGDGKLPPQAEQSVKQRAAEIEAEHRQ